MEIVTARHHRRGKIVVIDLVVLCREGVNIKTVSVEKIRQLLRPVQIKRLGVTEFGPNFEQSLYYFKRCETLTRILK